MQKKILHVQGYWSNEKIKKIPNISGIYFIYKAKKDIEKNCKIKELIFIGSGKEIRNEIEIMIEDETFQEILLLGNKILISYCAILDVDARLALTKNLIHQFKPVLNSSLDFQLDDNYSKKEFVFLGDNKFLEKKPSLKLFYN